MGIEARLELVRLDPAAELDALARSAPNAGAIVNFVGIARPNAKDGHAVDRLVLETHPRLTVKSLREVAAAAAERFDVLQVHVIHRGGDIAPGDAIVFAGAAANHRRAAFEAADYMMDRLKTEAIFWKREDGPAGTVWIEPTEADHADRRRWS